MTKTEQSLKQENIAIWELSSTSEGAFCFHIYFFKLAKRACFNFLRELVETLYTDKCESTLTLAQPEFSGVHNLLSFATQMGPPKKL